ncbi:MAG: 2,3-bisphosphoglycerate-independent phosphoglycerate mutase [Candidatus Azambacteria bacterium]|nr:2,3-bisphosphoglycerate-independent phosphoglycerate mutase [Candidatus Azambacteria bacterium]
MYKPVVLVIFDGYGRGPENAANAIFKAEKPNIDFFEKNFPTANLQASGVAVGLPWGEEGNSEVGHLNLGAGQIVYQYLPRVSFAIRDGSFFKNPALVQAAEHIKKYNSSFHVMGLLGSGNVHSYADHFYAILDFAKKENIKNVFIHAFTDGRDSPFKEALSFYEKVQNKLNQDYPFAQIVDLIGRGYSMERDNNWEDTEIAYQLFTESKGELFDNVKNAIESDYDKNITDESIGPKVIGAGTEGIATMGQRTAQRSGNIGTGTIKNNDAVIFFNFREDSARQLTRAFVEESFDKFPRKKIDNLYFTTMTRYQKDLPLNVLFEPLEIKNVLAKVVADSGKKQIHIAETEKYAHVTYFFNGGIEKPFPNEDRTLMPTKKEHNFSENPSMSAPEITEKILEAINSKNYDLIIANYANADMVGHTGNFQASVKAIEILDAEIGKISTEILKEEKSVLIITADHGNADDEINLLTGIPHPEHSVNPVPFYLIGNDFKREKSQEEIEVGKIEIDGILADVAPTILELMDLPQPPEMTGKSLLKIIAER